MFTGIVERVGLVKENRSRRLRVAASLRPLKDGDSVSVNGACLTVAARRPGGELSFDLSQETLDKTCLGRLRPGDAVNLERPLTPNSLIGGHLVTGHVDAKAEVLAARPLPGGCVRLRVSLPAALKGFVALKGSVAVEGVSLTVSAVGGGWFEAVLIPHTLRHTTLGKRCAGDWVNIEVDLLARYLNRILEAK